MRRWQEEELLKKICKTSLEQKDRIHCVLADIQEEELCDELNLMLCKSAVLERKARKRLEQEKEQKTDWKKEQKTDQITDQIAAIPENELFEKKLTEEKWREEPESDRQILQKEIPVRQAEMNQMKYALHQHRNAGIFASEMAKEWIDLQEEVLSKLEQYL